MRSLFLKIFLSFWGAQALFIVLAILVTIAMTPARQTRVENLGAQALTEAVSASQTGGRLAAGEYLEGFQHSHQVWAYVFDSSGREISGRLAPPWIEDTFRTGRPHHRGWLDKLMPERTSVQTLTINGVRYTLVLERPPGPRVFFGPHEIPLLGITIAVLSSGLVCYLLAWSLTSPVTRLRRAAQRLTMGDLSARTEAPMGRRRDELAQLVRDFDLMAEQIEKLVNAQSRLLKDISHELRSPLARLTVALELARQRTGPEAQSALERISLESGRMNELIGSLMTVARLESGAGGLKKTPVQLEDLIEEVARDAAFEAQSRNCQVEAEILDELPVVGDAALLRSAVENVVRNAVRYTEDGTTVNIRAERARTGRWEEAVIRVSDSGPGVPEDALTKIFQPFYRIDDARVRSTGGVGLGLAITDQAVRLHGGSVTASNLLEGGLAVEIRLPLQPSVAGEELPAGAVAGKGG